MNSPSSSLFTPVSTFSTYVAMSLFTYFDFLILLNRIFFCPFFLLPRKFPFAYCFCLLLFFSFLKGQLYPHSKHLSFVEILWSKQYNHNNNIITKGPRNPEQRELWLFRREAGARVRSLET